MDSGKNEFPNRSRCGFIPSIGSDGAIYVRSRDGNLYAINPDGSRKWAFEAGEDSSPAIEEAMEQP